jgi:DNA-binding HxlR family transcriptional regulator
MWMATQEARCDESLTRAFTLLGKRWTGMIIGVLLDRPVRFAELARAVPGITEGMLATRLRELQAAGLVERTILTGPPIGSSYRLTAAGLALEPALTELAHWAASYLPRPAKRAARSRSRS